MTVISQALHKTRRRKPRSHTCCAKAPRPRPTHTNASSLDGLDIERFQGDVTDIDSVRRLGEGHSMHFSLGGGDLH